MSIGFIDAIDRPLAALVILRAPPANDDLAREDEFSFLVRRIGEEIERVRAARCPEAAKAHESMAAAYRGRLADHPRRGDSRP